MSMLDEARKQINEIDAQMAELFEQRMHAVEDVIAYNRNIRCRSWTADERKRSSNGIRN